MFSGLFPFPLLRIAICFFSLVSLKPRWCSPKFFYLFYGSSSISWYWTKCSSDVNYWNQSVLFGALGTDQVCLFLRVYFFFPPFSSFVFCSWEFALSSSVTVFFVSIVVSMEKLIGGITFEATCVYVLCFWFKLQPFSFSHTDWRAVI